jgi:hypothetical protein
MELANFSKLAERTYNKNQKQYVKYSRYRAQCLLGRVLFFALAGVTALLIFVGAGNVWQRNQLSQITSERDLYSAKVQRKEEALAVVAETQETLYSQINDVTVLLTQASTQSNLYERRYAIASELVNVLQKDLELWHKVASIGQNGVVSDLTDLRITSNAAESQLNTLLENTPLEGKGWYFLESEREYGVNAIIMIAIMRQESQLGLAGSLWRHNNFAGLTNGRGGWASFATPRDGIFALARLLGTEYLTPDGQFYRGVSLDAVNILYAPLSDPRNGGWASGVRWHTNGALELLESTVYE